MYHNSHYYIYSDHVPEIGYYTQIHCFINQKFH